MEPTPIVFMILAMVVIWGSLLASTVFLATRPEVATWPPGGPTDEEDAALDDID
ncbi:MAG: methionine/alanine import family NSS transporter small subunit [Propionibacteriaceae bacterium]|jgi:hypothetical protein|nr:methionine/alanine import family NSS transporter small subunit [Propionibacteriaceae bacterium]